MDLVKLTARYCIGHTEICISTVKYVFLQCFSYKIKTSPAAICIYDPMPDSLTKMNCSLVLVKMVGPIIHEKVFVFTFPCSSQLSHL